MPSPFLRRQVYHKVLLGVVPTYGPGRFPCILSLPPLDALKPVR